MSKAPYAFEKRLHPVVHKTELGLADSRIQLMAAILKEEGLWPEYMRLHDKFIFVDESLEG